MPKAIKYKNIISYLPQYVKILLKKHNKLIKGNLQIYNYKKQKLLNKLSSFCFTPDFHTNFNKTPIFIKKLSNYFISVFYFRHCYFKLHLNTNRCLMITNQNIYFIDYLIIPCQMLSILKVALPYTRYFHSYRYLPICKLPTKYHCL